MLAGFFAAASHAQSWATRAYCDVTDPTIDPRVLPVALQQRVAREAAQIANGTGRYWKIETPQGAVSHLWGTMHSRDPLILDLPEMVMADIKTARVVALELDPVWPDRDSVQRSHAFEDWLRNGASPAWRFESENTGLPAPLIEQIRMRTEAIGWTRTAPDYLSFGGLATLLLGDPCEDFSAGVIPIQDGRIQMLGMISGAQIIGLEPENAFRRFLNAPENRATALSLISVYGSYLSPQPGERQTFFALYLEGRIGEMMAMDRILVSSVLGASGPKHLDRTDAYLLAARNARFVDRIKDALDTGGVFIAVGAFHLPGETGMVARLRNAGLTVTRVPLPGEATTP